jgi:hypothetical protein
MCRASASEASNMPSPATNNTSTKAYADEIIRRSRKKLTANRPPTRKQSKPQ